MLPQGTPQPHARRLGLEYSLQVVRLVKALHDSGLVHRDIKPHNLLLLDKHVQPGQPLQLRLADFGFTRQEDQDEPDKNKTTRKGTPYL